MEPQQASNYTIRCVSSQLAEVRATLHDSSLLWRLIEKNRKHKRLEKAHRLLLLF
jgi:hypothetical protein